MYPCLFLVSFCRKSLIFFFLGGFQFVILIKGFLLIRFFFCSLENLIIVLGDCFVVKCGSSMVF